MPSDPLLTTPGDAEPPWTTAAIVSGRPITRPRLHRGHFAFLRAVVQGLAPRAVWERYLPEAGDFDDAPRVHRMTGWIRAELAVAAARGGDFAQARLLRLDLAPPREPDLPALDTFAAAQGLDDFSEAEQLVAYEAAFGTALARQRRRIALLHRQLAVIHALEARIAAPPAPADGVEAWLISSLAARLQAAGVPSLGVLHARVAGGGAWWLDLRGIGAGKARALASFVAAHAATLGALPERASAPSDHVSADATTVVRPSPFGPLERLVLPPALSGAAGRFRAPPERCLLAAQDDRAAIDAWLAARGRGAPVAAVAGRARAKGVAEAGPCWTHTQLAYRKEAERLLLWAVLVRRQALSSLAVEDAGAYRDFLLAPDTSWCGPHAQPRWSSRWRPFAGALSPRSCSYAIGVLGNLFGFLVDQGYLIGNPWRAVSVPSPLPRGPDTGRGFTAPQWGYIREALDGLPAGLATQRLQVALLLLHDTGLRLAELLGATTDDLRWESLAGEAAERVEGWWLTVRGKGGKVREVPVPAAWIERLSGYLSARGYVGEFAKLTGVPLLGPARAARPPVGATTDPGVSGSVFHRQLKRFLSGCAGRLERDEPAAARRLQRASTHWLRHTHISHALDAGVPVEVVQQNVGHASLDTTTRYVRTEQARRQIMMKKLWNQEK